jgi:anti-sigma factor RsiW
VSEVPTQPSSLPPELDKRLARIEAQVGEMFELLKAWADEAQALRERQAQAERQLAEARETEKRLARQLASLDCATCARGELETPTEPSGLAPPHEPEHVT